MINIKTIKYAQIEEDIRMENQRERKFRGSIYIDVWVPETDNLETDREVAESKILEYANQIPNSYIGGVALYHTKGIMNPLDRDI